MTRVGHCRAERGCGGSRSRHKLSSDHHHHVLEGVHRPHCRRRHRIRWSRCLRRLLRLQAQERCRVPETLEYVAPGWYPYASLTTLLPAEKDKKRVKQATASQPDADVAGGISPEELRAALDKLRAEDVPTDPAEKEQFFMTQVGMGEQLCAQGVLRFYSSSVGA